MDNENKDISPVQGAQIRKKSEFSKIAEAFVPETRPNIGHVILKDIIAPMIKKLVEDTITNATHMALWGDSAGASSSSYISSNGLSRVNYSRISTDSYLRPGSSAASQPNPQSRADFGKVWFPDRGRADMALMDLQAAAERSKVITVADLYSVADVESNNYQINKYGWSSEEFLATAKVAKALDGGWYIKLPNPYQI